MRAYKIKDASVFPSRGQVPYKELFSSLREGKCIEIPVQSKLDGVKLRRALIASFRRWITSSEILKTTISNSKLFAVLEKKPQVNQ